MLFSSIIFIFYFFPVFLSIYLLGGMKTAILLTGSIVFYTWGEGAYVLLLCFLILLNFIAGRWIDNHEGRSRKLALLAVLVVDLGVLGLFKYADFFIANINIIFPVLELPQPHLKLPLGISFFTFQLVSYLVDVYRSRVPSESGLARFATYILMFPHLIAGPIVRYAEIREQLLSRKMYLERFGLGAQYFVVGLSQKVLIANSLAPLADYAFSLPGSELSNSMAWIGIVAYTLQIYFDFCGYSNMAIGLAFMLGFTFPRNFDYPYAAQSMTDFWRKWHISLSFWFRDYVYIPLGGNKGARWATFRNLLIVFFLTGLWHGASWNFIVWGLFHGLFLLLERVWLGRHLPKLPVALRSAYTVLAVMVGWVFFRAQDLSQALQYVSALWMPTGLHSLDLGMRLLLTPEAIAALLFGSFFAWPVLPNILDRAGVHRIKRSTKAVEERLDTWYVHRVPIVFLLCGLILSCALLVGSTLNPFLYFRF
jgi:alginate O-acetyltransferase complex protein AlgI